jgi:hypothetical protein
MTYRAPVKDMLFCMKELAGIDAVAMLPGFEEAGCDTAAAVLEECAKFNEGVVAPLNWEGDKNPVVLPRRQGHHHARLQGGLPAVRRRAAGRAAASGGVRRPGPAQDHRCGLRRDGQQRQPELSRCARC